MRIRVMGLVLAIVGAVLLMSPPVFARVNRPMLNVDWTPDICNNPYYVIQRCVGPYESMIDSSNYAIDFAESECNGGNYMDCFVTTYADFMSDQEEGSAFSATFWYGDEYGSWIVRMYENRIRDIIWPWVQDRGTCRYC